MQIQELNDLAIKIAEIKDQKDNLNKQLSELEKKLEPLQDRFNEILVEQGKPNWYVEGYGLFSPSKANWYKVKDYPKLREYMRGQGLDDMLTVNANALRGWLNAMPEWNSKFDEMVELTPKLSVSYKRGGRSEKN